MKFGLRDADLLYMQQLFAREPAIEQVWLVGSRAQGTHQPGSDVDLALVGTAIDRQLTARLRAILDEESPIPYFFDVVHWESLRHEPLKTSIQQTAQPIYKRAV